MNPVQLQSIVKRVTQRVLNRGSAASFGPRISGVHVDAGSPGNGPPAPVAAGVPPRTHGKHVTAEDLSRVVDGTHYDLPVGARPTALAEEEAWRRGIELRTAATGGRSTLRVALGADHGGYPVKELVKQWLRELGHVPVDLGTHDTGAVDYPDFARAVAESVASGQTDFGVCVDGAGIGSCIAANKVPGARAAMCYDEKTASNAREHNFANVLSLGGPMLGDEACRRILTAFLKTPEGAARHARRVEKICAIETHYTGHDHPLRRVLPAVGGT